jgi:hypothetical protein
MRLIHDADEYTQDAPVLANKEAAVVLSEQRDSLHGIFTLGHPRLGTLRRTPPFAHRHDQGQNTTVDPVSSLAPALHTQSALPSS